MEWPKTKFLINFQILLKKKNCSLNRMLKNEEAVI